MTSCPISAEALHLYKLLTGKTPVKVTDVKSSFKQTLLNDIEPFSESISEGLKAITNKCLSLEPRERYASVVALQVDIRKWQNGYMTDAEGANFAKAVLCLFKRHKVLAAMSFFTLFLSIFFLFSFKIKEEEAQNSLKMYIEQRERADSITKETFPKWVQEAGLKIRKFDFHDALENVSLAVERDPENALAWGVKGQLYFWRQEFRKSYECFLKAKELGRLNQLMLDLNKEYMYKSDKDLLSAEQLIELMIKNKSLLYAKRMVHFACSKIDRLEEKLKLVDHLLKETNKHLKSIAYECDFESKTMDFRETPKIRFLTGLYLLPIKKLNVSGTDLRSLYDINQSTLEELDISDCKDIKDLQRLSEFVSLKNLIQ